MDINELTYQIRGAVFEVNRVLGAGFLEKVYEKALLVEFHKRGLKAEGQVPITIRYKDEVVGEYFADSDLFFSHRLTRTDTDKEWLTQRRKSNKRVIASRKEPNVILSVCVRVSLWLNLEV